MSLHLKTTSSSESNSIQSYLPVRDRSPKFTLPERKRGTRVADLETRLGHAKEVMRKLKKQLASAENAKKDAQVKLKETNKMIGQQQDEGQSMEEEDGGFGGGDIAEEVQNATNVPGKEKGEEPNSPVQANSMDSKVLYFFDVVREEEQPTKEAPSSVEVAEELVGLVLEDKKPLNFGLEVEEKIARKEMEINTYIAENTTLKKQIEEANTSASDAKLREAELGLKVRSLTEELEHSKAKSDHLEEQLEAMEAAKIQLQTEMKRLRVQTDQWIKAADAAASIISGHRQLSFHRNCSTGGSEMSERLTNGYLGSPLMPSELKEETSAIAKRKIIGIRMFGELWKKKGHQK